MKLVQILHLAQVIRRGHHLDLVHTEQSWFDIYRIFTGAIGNSPSPH